MVKLSPRVLTVSSLLLRLSVSLRGDLGNRHARRGLVDDRPLRRVGGDEGLDREVVHLARQSPGDLVDERRGVVGPDLLSW